MRLRLSLLLILSSIYISTAQNISVKSFRVIENDLDARVNFPKRDQNNEVCAIIKVVTTHTGFDFEVGQLHIIAVEQKTSEIWVYVPHGIQRITIKHNQLGLLRDYRLGIPIEAATVYELVLTTGKVTTIVEEPVIKTHWLVITSNPEGADVFIDDVLVGKTPHQKLYKEGQYNYRVELPRYHTQAGRVKLEGEIPPINLPLKPKFGKIQVTSTPESGMDIYVNEEKTGKTTPATIEGVNSGENRVQLRSNWYDPQTKIVTVRDDETTSVDFQMMPVYADFTVNAKPSANIFINNERKGNTKWDGRLMKGIHEIKIEKEKYYTQTKRIEIIPGEKKTEDFELKPKMGKLNVSAIPIGADITIDGKEYGKTPKTIELMIGDYNLTLKKSGYANVNKKITISENQDLNISETMSSGSVAVRETSTSSNTTQKAGTFTDSRDGNVYKYVTIGEQVWMGENLKYLPSVVGPSTGSNTKPYYYVYGYNGTSISSAKATANYKTYGVLYNWPVAMNGERNSTANPSGVQGICPTGWHLPSDAEWKQLEMYLGMSQKDASDPGRRGFNEGGKLKEAGTSHWESPNTGATNKTGFFALPGGYRSFNGYFDRIGYEGDWWSATEYDDTYAWIRRMDNKDSKVYKYVSYKELGFSVRCVRD